MAEASDASMEQVILRAAERLFLQKGFALTSTTEIAREAGCNQALIHYYFRTKDNLFETVFAKKAEIFFTDIGWAIDPKLPFETTLRRMVEAHFELIRANPQLPFLLVNELTTNPARVEALKQRVGGMVAGIHSRLGAVLEIEIVAGRIRRISAFDLIFNVLSLNVAFFLGSPLVKTVLGLGEEAYEKVLESRKREIVETMIRSLRA